MAGDKGFVFNGINGIEAGEGIHCGIYGSTSNERSIRGTGRLAGWLGESGQGAEAGVILHK